MSSEPDVAEIPSAWPVRTLWPLDIQAGPCAWRATMLRTPQGLAHVREHPSLIVVEPEDDADTLQAVAVAGMGLPILLRMDEPDFVRRFESQVRARLAQLGRESVEIIAVNVQDTSELKSGGLLQSLFLMREQKVLRHVGLSTQEVLAAEWMSQHTAARVLMYPFSLGQQDARYRVFPLVKELGQLSIASEVTREDGDSLAFALGAAGLVLPVRDRPLPAGWAAMTGQAVEEAWQVYQATHKAPPPLPRSRPPE